MDSEPVTDYNGRGRPMVTFRLKLDHDGVR